MTTAILIPTLDRPQRILPTLEGITKSTTLPYRIYWCASDERSLLALTELGEWVLDDSGVDDHRYVTRMNRLVGLLEDEDTVFFGSDDVLHRDGWLEAALKALETAQVAVVNDLRNRNGTQALIRREYLEQAVFDAPGLAFHPGYLHNFADTEMFYTANRRGVYTRAMDSIVEHLHPLFRSLNALPWDKTYSSASNGWDHDEKLFLGRISLINEAIP